MYDVKSESQQDTIALLGINFCLQIIETGFAEWFSASPTMGPAHCTDSFENFREISFKGDPSNDITLNPPLFSLVNTFNKEILWDVQITCGSDGKLYNNGCQMRRKNCGKLVYEVGRCMTLKGLCHQLNIFLKSYKIKSVLSFFTFLACLVLEKNQFEGFSCFSENAY